MFKNLKSVHHSFNEIGDKLRSVEDYDKRKLAALYLGTSALIMATAGAGILDIGVHVASHSFESIREAADDTALDIAVTEGGLGGGALIVIGTSLLIAGAEGLRISGSATRGTKS